VGANRNNEARILAKIDRGKLYPFRIKLLSKKGHGLWYSLDDFDLATDEQRAAAKHNRLRKRTFA